MNKTSEKTHYTEYNIGIMEQSDSFQAIKDGHIALKSQLETGDTSVICTPFCNGAVKTERWTSDVEKVTCLNCLKALKSNGLYEIDWKEIIEND